MFTCSQVEKARKTWEQKSRIREDGQKKLQVVLDQVWRPPTSPPPQTPPPQSQHTHTHTHTHTFLNLHPLTPSSILHDPFPCNTTTGQLQAGAVLPHRDARVY
jgi:hypothetical protein